MNLSIHFCSACFHINREMNVIARIRERMVFYLQKEIIVNYEHGGIDLIRRQIELLKLLEKQSDFKPASFFSKALDVSTKTIYSDVAYLQQEAKKYSIELVRSPRIGIRLEGSEENIKKMVKEISSEEFNVEIKFSPDYRRLWILRKVLIDCKNITLEFLSKYFLVSKTSLYQDIYTINKMIDFHKGMELKVGEHGLELKSKESNIQNALKTFLLEEQKEETFTEFIYKLNQLFPSEIVKIVSRLILEDYGELTEDLSEYYLKSLLITIVAHVSRLQKGFHIDQEENKEISFFNSIKYMETYIVGNSIAEQLQEELKIHYNSDDKEYLCRQLFAHKVTKHAKLNASNYEETAYEIIARMSEIEKIDLTEDQRLYQALVYHLPAMIVRLKKNIKIVNPILDNIKEEYPELFRVVWYALSIIESKYQVTLTDDEVSLILLHFQVALDNFAEIGNIVVVCTYGVSSSQLILNRVKQILPSKDKITVMNLKKLQMADLSKVDLIITPIELDDMDIPYVKVNPILTKEDYTNILDAYTKHVLLVKSNLYNDKKNIHKDSILKRYLDPQFIFLNKKMKDKQACLDFIIHKLEKNKDVKQAFRESVFNREKMGVTCIDSGVALPHADPKTINRTRIVILTLEEAIDWGGIDVSLVILTAFPEAEMDQIRNVINELYLLIEKKENVDAFVQVNDVNEIMKKLS